MAKKKKNFPRKYILIILALVIGAAVILGITENPLKSTLVSSTTSFSNPSTTPELILQTVTSELPNATWVGPTVATQSTPNGQISGIQSTAQISTENPMLTHFENSQKLKDMGFSVDNNLMADGPGSSMWGYSKDTNGQKQYILISYKTQPTSDNPNAPLEFNCPCKMDITVFVSNLISVSPTGSSTGLANPASENCTAKGGTLSIQTNGNGGQYGLCTFEDNMACEEWALYRGECPVGGVKTTGYDNIDQMYCAWVGGQTLAVPNSQCTLPDGTSCATTTLYNNGTCS